MVLIMNKRCVAIVDSSSRTQFLGASLRVYASTRLPYWESGSLDKLVLIGDEAEGCKINKMKSGGAIADHLERIRT